MTTQSTKASVKSEIRGLIKDRIKAIREKNVNAVLSEYAPDVVMFNLAPPLKTTGADKKGIEEWFSGYKSEIDCEIRDLNITASDNVGYCYYLYRIRGTTTDGKKVDMWVRATLCLRKMKGKWLITHEHDSEPFDMETFKALLDLKP
jgi:ketosteroid isomerase-like protein